MRSLAAVIFFGEGGDGSLNPDFGVQRRTNGLGQVRWVPTLIHQGQGQVNKAVENSWGKIVARRSRRVALLYSYRAAKTAAKNAWRATA